MDRTIHLGLNIPENWSGQIFNIPAPASPAFQKDWYLQSFQETNKWKNWVFKYV